MQHNSIGSRGQRSLVPLIIVTGLFFMWGLLTSLNDVLIPHLKAVYSLTYVQAMLVQLCFFGAYFLVSLPAGRIIRRIGYQKGAVAGLVVAATGCALFYPASLGSYQLFLFALFVLASGITMLQVAANPYVTALGPAETASRRLTLTQAFNSLGTAIAPVLGGVLILAGSRTGADNGTSAISSPVAEAAVVQGPYLALAIALLVLAIVFALVKLPAIQEAGPVEISGRSIFAHRHLAFGVVAIFMYVGAEVSIGSFLINFLGEADVAGMAPELAAHYVGLYWAGAMVGRFIGVAVMSRFSPGKVLAAHGVGAIALTLMVMFSHSMFAMWAILAVGLMNSIMFPTIFSMALHKLGSRTSEASGLLCMAIVGGAVIPFVQGMFADAFDLRLSFIVPAACYGFVTYYGWRFADHYRR